MTQTIHHHQFDNGLTLLAEPMPWLESAAYSLLLPAGCAYDPEQTPGLANFTADMVQRGCGDMDSRQYLDALERLGVAHHASVGTSHSSYGGAVLADLLPYAMELNSKMVLQPKLPTEQLEQARNVCFQELRSIEDNLAQRLFIELYERIYPQPWGRSTFGNPDSVAGITHDDVTRFVESTYRPCDAIISVAGKFDWLILKDIVTEQLAAWPAGNPTTIDEQPVTPEHHHIEVDSAQTHIALACPSIPYQDENYFLMRGAIGVLADGMSSRLFTEVREKQGLCYTVNASLHTTKDLGHVVCYSATSTDRAQQTLDSILEQCSLLADGVRQDELDRLKAQIKSSLIMSQESSYRRASSIAADWYYLGKTRTTAELSAIIDALTCDTINEYLKANPLDDFTVVTLGAEPLELS